MQEVLIRNTNRMVEGESMIKEPRKRTEKVFEEYNDYQDRGMVKWLTAFSMEELTRCVLQDLSTQYCKEKVHTFAPEIFL